MIYANQVNEVFVLLSVLFPQYVEEQKSAGRFNKTKFPLNAVLITLSCAEQYFHLKLF